MQKQAKITSKGQSQCRSKCGEFWASGLAIKSSLRATKTGIRVRRFALRRSHEVSRESEIRIGPAEKESPTASKNCAANNVSAFFPRNLRRGEMCAYLGEAGARKKAGLYESQDT